MSRVLFNNLLTYLQSNIGCDNIIEDKINKTYLINSKVLCEVYPFKQLEDFCKNSENAENIKITQLIIFLTNDMQDPDIAGSNNSKNKVGKIPILFPLINSIYQITYISKNILISDYNYNVVYRYKWYDVDKNVKKNIYPKRVAFKICDMIRENVKNEFNDELVVYFEVNFDDGTDKKYDVGIALSPSILKETNIKQKFIIIIEIQEKGKIHNDNPNDKDKEYIVNSKGIITKYFRINEKHISDYQENFYADLLHTCYKVLIATSANYRNKILLKESIIIINKKIKKLEEELTYIDPNTKQYEFKKENIIRLIQINEDTSNTTVLIKELYKYKIDAYNNNIDIFSEYNIPLKIVKEHLDLKFNLKTLGNLNKDDDKKLIDELILTYTISINNKYYFTYENLYKFLVALNIKTISQLKNNFICILLCTQKIYEHYIKIINQYNKSIIDKLKEDNSLIKDTITQKLETKFLTLIENRDQKIKLLDKQVKNLLKENNIENKINIETQLIDGKPIIGEDCKLYYSDDNKKNILSLDALAILKNYGVNDTEARKILNEIHTENNEENDELVFKDDEKIENLYYLED